MSELKPGRELDALIAEKVMELECVSHSEHFHNGALVYGECRIMGGKTIVPHYSTSIEAAWEVVEMMNKKTWSDCYPMQLELRQIGMLSAQSWMAVFWYRTDIEEDGSPSYAATADTAPHAICLAALRAVSSGPVSE